MTSKECDLTIDYQHAHEKCLSMQAFTCNFKSGDFRCKICKGVMKNLPSKKLYCPECANDNKLCPFTFCDDNQKSSKRKKILRY